MPRRPQAIRTLTAPSWTDCERFAAPLSMRMIGELLGVPTGEGERFRKLVDPLLTRLDPAETDADQSALSDLLQGLLAGNASLRARIYSAWATWLSRRGIQTAQVAWEKTFRIYVTCHVYCEDSLDSDVSAQ
jgi:cytochrome P450